LKYFKNETGMRSDLSWFLGIEDCGYSTAVTEKAIMRLARCRGRFSFVSKILSIHFIP
jgi:hypothetical protein